MNKMIVRLGVTMGLAAMVAGGALAGPPKAKPVACPVCHMPLASKASKADPVAVKLTPKGKTMYCCPACKMPASVLVKKK